MPFDLPFEFQPRKPVTRKRGTTRARRVSVIDVAAPGRSAHHPGITPRGVICGDRDNSPAGRGVRVVGPRVSAEG
jgi:hypothetical protein